jgi:hypothetical protein
VRDKILQPEAQLHGVISANTANNSILFQRKSPSPPSAFLELSTINSSRPTPPFDSFSLFLLHTYLLDSSLAQESGAGGTSPPLHIGVTRIVYLASVT